jgi:hypothetical protein
LFNIKIMEMRKKEKGKRICKREKDPAKGKRI